MKMVASQAQCNSMQLWSICSIFIFITVNIQVHLCQGISCKVIPTQIIGRVNGDTAPFSILSGDNCTRCSDTEYFHCYSPTRLSDGKKEDDDNIIQVSVRGFHRERFYQWRYSLSDVPVLFVFPTNFQLNSTKLYYESGQLNDNTLLGFSKLTFYHVPNDFEIWNYSNLSQLEQLTGVVQLGEHPYRSSRNSYNVLFFTLSFKRIDTSTNKLLMVITFIQDGVDFGVSEMEFNVMSNISNCSTPEDEGDYITCRDVPKVKTMTTASTKEEKNSPTPRPAVNTTNQDLNDKTSPTPIVNTTNQGGGSNEDGGTAEIAGALSGVVLVLIVVVTVIIVLILILKKRNYKTTCEAHDNVFSPPQMNNLEPRESSEETQTVRNNETRNLEHPNNDPETGQAISPLYACVQKKKKIKKEENQEDDVSYPPSCDALYTAVQKKPKRDVKDKVQDEPESHSIGYEDMCTAVQKKKKQAPVSDDQHDDDIECYPEHVYSAVQKKKKQAPVSDDQQDDDIECYPEHVYSAIQKKKNKSNKETTTLDEMYSVERESSDTPAHDLKNMYAVVHKK